MIHKFKIYIFDMGITGLAKLIADIAPNAIKENEIKNHFGKLLGDLGAN